MHQGSRASLGVVVVALALASAFLFGTSNVLMHAKAKEAPGEHSLRPALLVHLVQQRQWLGAIGVQMVGTGVQAVALERGSISLVQAIAPTALLFSLPFAARLAGKQLRPREWAAAAATVSGLAALLAVASPGDGKATASTSAWIVLVSVTVVVAAALVGVGRRLTGPARAVVLGLGAGATLGLVTAITKSLAERFANGMGAGFSGWELYGLAVFGLTGITLVQSAFQAGDIEWSLPALTVMHPLAAILAGATAFHEPVNVAGFEIVAAAASVAAMVAGIVVLARSPALVALHEVAPG